MNSGSLLGSLTEADGNSNDHARIKQRSGARFSKVPILFGHVSGDIILFVSSKRRRLETRNFAVILIFIPFTTYEKTSFTESAGRSSRNGFSGPNGFRDFRETGPWPEFLESVVNQR